MTQLKIFLNGELLDTISLDESQEYVFGRGKGCDFVFEKDSGISRQHFRIFFDSIQWYLEVTSQFGGLLVHGAETESLALENGGSFQLKSYEFSFSQKKPEQETAVQQNEGKELIAQTNSPNNSMIQQDETVIESYQGHPYLKVERNGDVKSLRLEGNLWTAGRDSTCEIFIKDRGASRRHFELSIAGGQAFVVDLNSANGTMLNGEKVTPDQAIPIKSGDIISVLSVQMTFELKNSNFEEHLNSVPENIMQPMQISQVQTHSNPLTSQTTPESTTDDTAKQQKELIKPSLKNVSQWQDWEINFKKNKYRLGDHKKQIAIAVGLLFIVHLLLSPDPKAGKNPQRVPANAHETFVNLKPEKKAFIRDTYKLAKNLYLKRNYPLAQKELSRIHELVPFYEDSRKLAEECKQYIDIKTQREYIARKKQEAADLKRRINEKVFRCEKWMNAKTTQTDLNRCLGDALDLDPTNQGIARLRAIIEEREAEAQRIAQQKAHYQKLVNRGRSFYNKARKLEKNGNDYHAIKAYQRFLKKGLPDPSGLKKKARRNIASLKNNLQFKVDSIVRRAKSYFDQSNYKKAMTSLEESFRIDPNNSLAHETRREFKKQISRQMKAIYQDSVLEESLGNSEAAKDKWRKIKELSYPEDPYYQKAVSKLRKFGD